jgi:hypothetical protein
VYVDLPPEFASKVEHAFMLVDPPAEHDGNTIEDHSMAHLGELYISALTRMVDEFVDRFGT